MSEAAEGGGAIAKGFFLGIGLGTLQGFVTWGVAAATNSLTVIVMGLLFFGLIQLVYMVPVYFVLKQKRPAMAPGLAIAGCLIAMINIACATTMR